MSSDTPVPDIEIDSDAPRPALWWRGIVLCACAFAVVGLLDVLLSLARSSDVVEGADALGVVVFYAAFFAPFGLLAALVARFFEWSQRALALVIACAALVFLVGAWLNIEYLPDFLSAFSLLTDLAILVVVLLLFRNRYFAPGYDEIRWGRWLGIGALSLIVAGVLGLLPGREDGESPKAVSLPESPRANVLVYLVDTLRADHLSCYGYDRPTSPEIDAFAQDAVLFEQCWAPSSWTKPSTASLMTSLYPSSHAAVGPRDVLVPDAETLAEVFHKAGWRTGGYSDNPFVSPRFGLAQGFGEFYVPESVQPSVVSNGTLIGKVLFMLRVRSLVGTWFGVGDEIHVGCRALQERALGFIDAGGGESAKDEPFFAYVHTMEPHLPYDPPRGDAEAFGFPAGEEYAGTPPYNGILPFQTAPEPPPELLTKLTAQYDGEIRDVSRGFGELIAALKERGEYENTIVIVLADHGEELHDHGGWTHGHSLHQEVTRVPLIVRLPDSLGERAKAARGRRVRGAVSLVDLMPTLVGLQQIRYPRLEAGPTFGISLEPYLVGTDGEKPRDVIEQGRFPVIGEVSMGSARLRSIRHGRWALIRARTDLVNAREQLYDTVSDRVEEFDRIKENFEEARKLGKSLDEVLGALEGTRLSGGKIAMDPELEARLEALGYLQKQKK